MSDQAPTPNDAANAAQSGTQAPVQPTTSQELPDWAQKELSDARGEAAKYRTEKNAAVEQARQEAETKFAEAKAELENNLSKSEENLLRLKIAVGAEIASDKLESFAARLQGNNEEELRADAETLKGLFSTPESPTPSSTPAVDRSQGSGSHLPLNGDPLLNALKSKVGIR